MFETCMFLIMKRYDRESNIMKNVYDLSPIAHLPEAHDLIASMIHPEPEMRYDG